MKSGNPPIALRILRAYSRYRQNRHTDRLLEANLVRCANPTNNADRSGSKKKYMIIRKKDPNNGLSAYIMSSLVSIEYAVRKGLIPVIDMQSYPTPYTTKNENVRINSWELFFEQPCGVGLEGITSEQVLIEDSAVSGNYQKLGSKKVAFLDGSDSNIYYWKKIYSKYIRPNSAILERFNVRKQELFGDKGRIVGVLGRGTDYSAIKPKGHAIQPDTQELIAKTKEMMESHACNSVFLATEDQSIYSAFVDEFGSRLIVNYIPDVHYTGGWLNESYSDAADKSTIKDRIGIDYLINLMLLSQCDYFVGGITGGTAVVMLMDNTLKDIYLFDLGQYE